MTFGLLLSTATLALLLALGGTWLAFVVWLVPSLLVLSWAAGYGWSPDGAEGVR